MKKQHIETLAGAVLVIGGLTAACLYASIDQPTKIHEITAEETVTEAATEAPTLTLEPYAALVETRRARKPSQDAPGSAGSDETAEEAQTLEETAETAFVELTEPDAQTPCMAGNDQLGTCQRLMQSATPAERDMLARIARAECGGESVQSMACIVCVVLNRVADPCFPNTIQGVIESPGQFKVVASGAYYQPASEKAWQAVELVSAGYDPSYGATYFSTGRSAWHWNALQYLGTFEKIYLYHEWEAGA